MEKNKADNQAKKNLFQTKSKPCKQKVFKKADITKPVTTTVNLEQTKSDYTKQTTTETYSVNCPACNEKYEDSPIED